MMVNANSVYPDFVPNQVLTNRQLNQLREYLDQQDRLGRVRLVGAGIVCGLNVTVNSRHHISVTDGFGVGSEGYLLGLEMAERVKTTFTHWRNYTDPDVGEDGEVRYEAWQKAGDSSQQRPILQLTDDASDNALDEKTLDGRVLVLYLERRNEKLDSCLVTDCDSKGVNVHFAVRALLVDKEALQAVTPCESAKGKTIKIPRLHSKLDLAATETAVQIDEAYLDIARDVFNVVLERLTKSYKEYAGMLAIDESLLEFLQNLEDLLFDNPSQYVWDILNDIADAHNEFIEAACGLIQPCISSASFPRHLMLGAFDGGTGYRQAFQPSPLRNVAANDLERVRKLFLRILLMIGNLQPGKGDEIIITPSHTRLYPLGERAMPFYYSSEIEAWWQPQLCCTTRDVWSYFVQQKLESFDYAEASLLRIEGHVGRPCEKAFEQIQKLRAKYNLEFDLLSLPVAKETEDDDTLACLATDIPGMEHMAGVVKGGTFILVCDEQQQVVADFSLAGQIPCCRYLEPTVQLGSIGGHFTDENGSALVGGQVVLLRTNSAFRQTAVTDEKARFLFGKLQPGAYTLRATLRLSTGALVASDTVPVALAAGEEQVINLIGKTAEVIRPGIIRGRTLTEANVAVPNAVVVVKPIGQTQTTGNKGEFEFKALEPGDYTVQASFTAQGNLTAVTRRLKTKPVSVKLDPAEIESVELIFKIPKQATGVLDVQLIDTATKKPITLATVTIRNEASRADTTSLTKPNANTSHFRFAAVAPGSYTIEARATGFMNNTVDGVKVSADKTVKQTLRMIKQRVVIDNPVIINRPELRPLTDRPIVIPRDVPIEHISRNVDKTGEEIRQQVNALFAERFQTYQQMLEVIPESVKRSNAGRLAGQFLRQIMSAEVSDETAFADYTGLTDQALKTLASNSTSETNKPHYQSLVSAASLAMLDRLMLSNPEILSADAEAMLRRVKLTLNKAGIKPAAFKKAWNAKPLRNELLMSSVKRVNTIMR